MIGQRVNNFEIVRLIGEGAMGVVYEAAHPLIPRKIAVKVLQKELAKDTTSVERFFSEARITSAIRHPNIVEIIDVGTLADGVPYLAMEMLEGECLGVRLMRENRIDCGLAIDIAVQAASGLEAAHARGVVHRDLKPEHLFLVPDQRLPGRELVKVLDFGIAKLRSKASWHRVQTFRGTVIGTPLYMSPEQCSGLSDSVDHRTDIYALGIILYEALCGQPPFIAPGLRDVLMMHTLTAPVPPSRHRPDLPRSVENIILKALAKAPEDRFSSMAEMGAALRAVRLSTVRFSLPYGAAADLDETVMSRVHDSPSPPSGFGASRTPSTPSSGELHLLTDAQRRWAPERAEKALDHTTGGIHTLQREPLHRKRRGWLIGLGACAVAAVAVLSQRQERADSARAIGATTHPVPPTAVAQTVDLSSNSPLDKLPGDRPPEKLSGVATRAPAIHTKQAAASEMKASTLDRTLPSESPMKKPTDMRPSGADVPPPSGRTAELAPQDHPPAEDPQPGYLSLDSAPWGNVYLGSKLLGSTPLLHIPLAPGKHVLTLKNPELHRSTTYAVEIEPAATVSRFVGWEAEGK